MFSSTLKAQDSLKHYKTLTVTQHHIPEDQNSLNGICNNKFCSVTSYLHYSHVIMTTET